MAHMVHRKTATPEGSGPLMKPKRQLIGQLGTTRTDQGESQRELKVSSLARTLACWPSKVPWEVNVWWSASVSPFWSDRSVRTQGWTQEGNFSELTVYLQKYSQKEGACYRCRRRWATCQAETQWSARRNGKTWWQKTKKITESKKKAQLINVVNTQFTTGTDETIWRRTAGAGCLKGQPVNQISCRCGGPLVDKRSTKLTDQTQDHNAWISTLVHPRLTGGFHTTILESILCCYFWKHAFMLN